MGAGRSREERERLGEKKRRQWTTQSEPPLGAPKQWIFSLELTGVVFFTVWRGLSHCGRKKNQVQCTTSKPLCPTVPQYGYEDENTKYQLCTCFLWKL